MSAPLPGSSASVAGFRGILFDLDGTLGDTLPVCITAFQQVFRARLGHSFSANEVLAMFGPDEEGVIRRALPQAWQPALAEYLALYKRLHAGCPEPFVGIRPLIAALKARGVRLGIVTAKGAASAAISARIWRMEGEFEGIEAGSAAGADKPAGMRRFLARWQLAAPEVAYVGDGPYDMDAARAVGVAAIAAAWAPAARVERLAARKPDQLFHSVAAFADWLGVGETHR
ncbi:MAG TPA: HAD hydrolase-like protein [Rhodanobacteraceae bacterium]